MKKRDELPGLHNVQTKLNDKEYFRLKDFAREMNVSQVRAVRGIILEAIEKDLSPVREIVLTTDERNLVRRVIDIYRSGDKVVMDSLMCTVRICERALIASHRHRPAAKASH